MFCFFLADIMFDEEDFDLRCFLNSFLPDEYNYSIINFETIKSDKLNPQFLVELRVNVQNLEQKMKG